MHPDKSNVLWGMQTSNHQIVPRNEYTEKQCSSIGDSENSDASSTNDFSFASKAQDTVVACIDDGTRPISNTYVAMCAITQRNTSFSFVSLELLQK